MTAHDAPMPSRNTSMPPTNAIHARRGVHRNGFGVAARNRGGGPLGCSATDRARTRGSRPLRTAS
jgi:hypothetical protein